MLRSVGPSPFRLTLAGSIQCSTARRMGSFRAGWPGGVLAPGNPPGKTPSVPAFSSSKSAYTRPIGTTRRINPIHSVSRASTIFGFATFPFHRRSAVHTFRRYPPARVRSIFPLVCLFTAFTLFALESASAEIQLSTEFGVEGVDESLGLGAAFGPFLRDHRTLDLLITGRLSLTGEPLGRLEAVLVDEDRPGWSFGPLLNAGMTVFPTHWGNFRNSGWFYEEKKQAVTVGTGMLSKYSVVKLQLHFSFALRASFSVWTFLRFQQRDASLEPGCDCEDRTLFMGEEEFNAHLAGRTHEEQFHFVPVHLEATAAKSFNRMFVYARARAGINGFLPKDTATFSPWASYESRIIAGVGWRFLHNRNPARVFPG